MSKKMHIDNSDNIVKRCNNTHHRTIEMKPIDVESSLYINFAVENN